MNLPEPTLNTEQHTTEEIIKFLNISSEQKRAVKSFWESFDRDQAQLCDYFDGKLKTDIDIPGWVETHLQPIDKDIMWEFGPGLKKTHRLVITSETNRSLRPLVQYILSQAPEYKDWEFYEYRLAEDLVQLQQTMAARTNWQDISEIEFELTRSEFNTIAITYYVPASLEQETKESHSYNACVLTEALLGEEDLDKWIDYIDVFPKAKSKFFKKTKISAQPLSALKEAFLTEIKTIKVRLPHDPYYKVINNKNTKWGLMEMTPGEQNDYPRKQDLYVSPFILLEDDLFNATYIGYKNFFSERFSNYNEKFLYLKIDGTAEDLNQEIFIDRSTIEDMLNEVLQEKKLGCVIGGGTGLRYSYIDFALTDLKKAIETIREHLQKGKLTKRSWILFHDASYQSQWIGIWDDSPPPPM